MVGSLIAPLPLLEIRAPVVGRELQDSLRLAQLIMAAGVGAGLVAAWLLRNRGHFVERAAAAVAGVAWIATTVADQPLALGLAIFIGLAASWAALLCAVHNGIAGRGVLGMGAIVVAIILVLLSIWPERGWQPLAALCGAIALVAAALAQPPVPAGGPTTSSLSSMINHRVLLAVAAGITWGTTPAVNRVTWSEFRAVERYNSITLAGGALFAIVLVVIGARQAGRGDSPAWLSREAIGLLIGGAFVVISIAPTLAITMIARAATLGGADLLIAGTGTDDTAKHHAERWPYVTAGIVFGLTFSAFVTVDDSINPKLATAFLSLLVLGATAGDFVAGRSGLRRQVAGATA
jgi:hypothetical protein